MRRNTPRMVTIQPVTSAAAVPAATSEAATRSPDWNRRAAASAAMAAHTTTTATSGTTQAAGLSRTRPLRARRVSYQAVPASANWKATATRVTASAMAATLAGLESTIRP